MKNNTLEGFTIEKYYVYRFLDKDENILYVGKTSNMRRRFVHHDYLNSQVDKIEYIECQSSGEADWKEPYYINLFYSPYIRNTAFINDDSHEVTDLHLNDIWIPYEAYKDGINLDNLKDDICLRELEVFYRDFVNHNALMINPELIHIFDNKKMNHIGEQDYDMTQKWFTDDYQFENTTQLKNNILNYFMNYMPNTSGELSYLKSWTTYANCKHLLKGKGYTKQFVPMWNPNIMNPTNAIYLTYAANNYLPAGSANKDFSSDQYALAILLNFISRSAIRNGKDIQIYTPSARMRRLLTQWIDDNSRNKSFLKVE